MVFNHKRADFLVKENLDFFSLFSLLKFQSFTTIRIGLLNFNLLEAWEPRFSQGRQFKMLICSNLPRPIRRLTFFVTRRATQIYLLSLQM